MSRSPRSTMRGVSLIELMIAMLIGVLLLLGLVQVFAASKVAYQASEGLARVQENGRFAMDFLQRDLRMAGHFGCVNDQARLQIQETGGNPDTLVSHVVAGAGTFLDFSRSIQGFEAVNTAPGGTWNLATTTGGTWLPAVPAGYVDQPRAGSDIVVLRYFSGEGIPVTGVITTPTQTTIQFDKDKWPVLTQNGVASPEVFGMSDCTFADVFQANTVDPVGGTITVSTAGGKNSSVINERFTASPEGQTMLYRAESIVYYVRTNAQGEPALYRTRSGGNPEELVEGVESLQLLYGQDANTVANLNGNILLHNVASSVGANTEPDWRRVGAVQVGLLMRSASRSGAAAPTTQQRALGLGYTNPNDGRFRAVYESTVALRNRLYGN